MVRRGSDGEEIVSWQSSERRRPISLTLPTPSPGSRPTDFADVIRGFENKDQLSGLGGNDKIFGNGDNDAIFGGSGDDAVNGAAVRTPSMAATATTG